MKRSGVVAFATVPLLIIAPTICSGERIRTLLTGQVDESSNPLIK